MATQEEIDEAAQLRFLALQSMVKRVKQTNSNNKFNIIDTDNNYDDDTDIKSLRAAALKTIINKQTISPLRNRDEKLQKCLIINEKKRGINDQDILVTTNNKHLKSNGFDFAANNTEDGQFNEPKNIPEKNDTESNHISVTESPNKQVAITQNENAKIVRNGCMQLSNLDSEKVDETMIIRIAFSSSDDSSSDSFSESVQKYIKNKREFNSKQISSSTNNGLNDLDEQSTDILSTNRFKANNCMREITTLMKTCESEIERRNEQIKILLEAYEKYQSHNKTLCNILQEMKSARDELSKYRNVDNDTN